MPVRETSIQAYHEEQPNIGRRQMQVLQAFKAYGPMNNRIVAARLDLPVNQITPRTFELRNMGLLREVGKCRDQFTGKTCLVFAAEMEGQQIDLF